MHITDNAWDVIKKWKLQKQPAALIVIVKEKNNKIFEIRHNMSISRRKFLSWAGAAGVAATLSTKAKASTNKHFEGYPESYAVLHDAVLCEGCRECESACNKVNDLPKPEKPFNDLSVLDKKRRTTEKAAILSYQGSGDGKHWYLGT